MTRKILKANIILIFSMTTKVIHIIWIYIFKFIFSETHSGRQADGAPTGRYSRTGNF